MRGAIQTVIAPRGAGFLGGVANSNPTRSKNTVASEDVKVGKFVTDGTDGVANIVDTDSVIAGVVAKTSTMQENTITTDKELHEKMYEVIHSVEVEPNDVFPVMYNRLISKEKGPKLAGFIRTIGKERVLRLFS